MMSFALFGVTGAIAFRAINTLDGMVGFKDKEHINTGWFSANLDTIVNYIPTRLTALLMIVAAAILRKDAGNAWRIAQQGPQENTEQKPRLANGCDGWRTADSTWRSLGNTFSGTGRSR